MKPCTREAEVYQEWTELVVKRMSDTELLMTSHLDAEEHEAGNGSTERVYRNAAIVRELRRRTWHRYALTGIDELKRQLGLNMEEP